MQFIKLRKVRSGYNSVMLGILIICTGLNL